MRGNCAAVIAVVVQLVLGNITTAEIRYAVRDLGVLPGHMCDAGPYCQAYGRGVNTDGHVVGYMYSGDGHLGANIAFISDGWHPMQSFVPSSGNPSTAEAINDAGQVAGQAVNASGESHAFFWSGSGPVQDLGTLGGSSSYAYAINYAGQVAGYASNASGESHAFFWSGSGPLQDLGTLGGASSYAYGVSDGGQVVGSAYNADGQMHAFFWGGSGALQDLGTLGGSYSCAYGVNYGGQVVGSAYGVDGREHAFFWNGSDTLQDLGTLGGASSYAYAINDSGQVVGSSRVSTGSGTHAFVCSGSGPLEDLNGLIDPSSGWVLSAASDVSNQGHIVGNGTIGGRGRAFLLTPLAIAKPALAVAPASLTVETYLGSDPPDGELTVRNAGYNTLSYSITVDAGWISVTPESGESTGEIDTIAVHYTTASLPLGEHLATITVDAPGAYDAPQTIQVTLIVTPVPADFNGDGDVDLNDFSVFQTCFAGPNRAPAEGCVYDADLDNDADVDLTDFSIFQSCFNGPNRPPNC